jgi:hypothetical protein
LLFQTRHFSQLGGVESESRGWFSDAAAVAATGDSLCFVGCVVVVVVVVVVSVSVVVVVTGTSGLGGGASDGGSGM